MFWNCVRKGESRGRVGKNIPSRGERSGFKAFRRRRLCFAQTPLRELRVGTENENLLFLLLIFAPGHYIILSTNRTDRTRRGREHPGTRRKERSKRALDALNIELQCCALATLVVIAVLFRGAGGLRLSNRRLYFFALLSSILCLLLDILSIVGIYAAINWGFPSLAAKIVCKLYIVSLAFQTYQGFLYAASEFFVGGSHVGIRRIFFIWFLFGAFAIAVSPIDYYLSGRIVYSFGAATTATYIVTLIFIVSTIAITFIERDKTSRNRRRAILIWQGSWLVAALIQLLLPELLLVGFATAFGMILLYAELENPNEGIDRETGLFTANALVDYLNDCFLNRRRFASLHVRLERNERVSDPEKRRSYLIRVANQLHAMKGVYVFRNTDHELVLIFPDRESLEREYERVCREFDDAAESPIRFDRILVPDCTVIGSADEYNRLISFFEAEQESRNEITVDRTAVARFREHSRMHELLLSALSEGRVEVFYQPFYDVREKRFTAAEALVRIRDADGTVVPPGRFISVAEETGLIVPLGADIFRRVCAFLASGEPQKRGITHIEINLSIKQFSERDPADLVQSVMREYGIDPALVNLEITETASVSTKKIVLRNMRELIAAGVRFALDDFGTGRSNLDYFLEMPVNIIKFDHSFTQSYFQSERAKTVIESTIGLMHKNGMEIVSEGVETREQFDAMCALGVEYVQGYYFSKPLPEADFLAFLDRNALA